MATTKEKIMSAVSVMNDSDAEFLWDTIEHMYSETNKKSVYISIQEAFYFKNRNKIKVIRKSGKILSFTRR